MISKRNFLVGWRQKCWVGYKQSHYIEVTQGDIFMKQKMWFGPIMSNFWGWFFHVFGCKNVFFSISFGKCCRVRTENLHNINLRFFFSIFWPPKTWKNRPQIGLNSQSIVYCSIGDTSLRDFYIMTLGTRHLKYWLKQRQNLQNFLLPWSWWKKIQVLSREEKEKRKVRVAY